MPEPAFLWNGEFAPLCELGMSATRAAEPSSWMDVSCYVHEAEIFRGRERFNERFEPGTVSITFSNASGWGDLVGAPSIVETQPLRPGRPMRIGVRGPFDGAAPTTRWLFRGWIDQAAPAYHPTEHDVITVQCIDSLGEAGMTTAPEGPPQGAHETADVRINRVLDAVGWFPTKRKIATTTTRVQGTHLGSQSIDLMGAAADSAGGVVFGDLDGDVVFKDIDWMLYDPDDPPDAEIGDTDPGTPGLPIPPHVDVTPGVIYDPEIDSPTPPTVELCFDSPPSDGTVIEQGDAWSISIQNGHLIYESSGHRWDMGPWDALIDRCTTITPPSGGGGPPTRTDGPGQIPTDGLPMAWEFTAEMIAYSDASTAYEGPDAEDPVQAVTIAVPAPGPGALLVVAMHAVCSNLTAGYLSPYPDAGGSVTGGAGLTWEQIGIRQIVGGYGIESHAVAAQVGRDDPGPFDLVVDWSLDHMSVGHIITVWKVIGHRQDMLDRMKLSAYLHGANWDWPTPPNPATNSPGKGPAVLPFSTSDTAIAGSQVQPYSRLTDIAIGQSLADSPDPPFGATFDDTDGPWVTPVFANAAVAATEVVCDDFERANGPLGAAWAPVFELVGEAVNDLVIIGGAAEDGRTGTSPDYRVAGARYAAAQGPDQSVEADLEQLWQTAPADAGTAHYLILFTHATAGDGSLRQVEMNFDRVTNAIYLVFTHSAADGNGTNVGTTVTVPAPSPLPATMRARLESDADGTMRAYLDNVLVATAVDPTTLAGAYVGMGTASYLHFGTVDQWLPGVRFREVCVGGGGGIIRKCSWVAGYRPNAVALNAKWTEVNTGPDNIQSAQLAVVVESGENVGFAWRALGYHLLGPTSGTPVAAGSHATTIRPERNSVIIVAVFAFASPASGGTAITVSIPGTPFTTVRTQAPGATGWGRGAIFSTKLDGYATDPATPLVVTVQWGTAVEKISYVIYEVSNADAVVQSASGVIGNHVAGSVNGPASIDLGANKNPDSVILGFLGASGGGGAQAGATFDEEIEILPTDQSTWIHTESRSDIDPAHIVDWTDVDTATGLLVRDAVMFAVEVTPDPDFAAWSSFDPLVIGGARDAFSAPIYSATGTYPSGGPPSWTFDPSNPV